MRMRRMMETKKKMKETRHVALLQLTLSKPTTLHTHSQPTRFEPANQQFTFISFNESSTSTCC